MTEATRHANKEISFVQLIVEWLMKLNPRLVAYATGVVLSVVSFGMLFSSFRPIPVGSSGITETEQVAIFPVISGSDREYHSYNGLPADEDSSEMSIIINCRVCWITARWSASVISHTNRAATKQCPLWLK